MQLAVETRVAIIELFYENRRSAAQTVRAYKTLHQLRHDPFSTSTVARLVEKFKKTGSVLDAPKSGRPSISEDVVEMIKDANVDGKNDSMTGCFSAHDIAKATAIPYSTVRKVLRTKLACKPYHIKKVQALQDGDPERRMDFAGWLLDQDPSLLRSILWTDEAHFYLTGHVSTRHCVIWSSENPHQTVSAPLHSPKVTVWCGFTQDFIISPVFVESPNTVNQDSYLAILKDHVAPLCRRRRNLTSMQDGATPHTAKKVRDYLTSLFQGRVIGLRFDREWPPRSPDLNPCDFFLWGYLKFRVHRRKPSTIEQLKQIITDEVTHLPQELLQKSAESILDRCMAILSVNGEHIEQ